MTVTPSATQTGRTNASSLNLRSEASTNAQILAMLPQGTILTIFRTVSGSTYNPGSGNRNDWYEVEANGRRGYVAVFYVDIIGNGQRITDAVNRVNPDQQFYQQHDITGDGIPETFCNWFAADVLELLGVNLPRHNQLYYPPVFSPASRQKPLSAEQLYRFFPNSGGQWQMVSAANAVVKANNGQAVVASSDGHIAILVPGGSSSDVRVAQAGRVNGKNISVTQGFGSQTPLYFAYAG